jgi:ATP-dependent Clp endopeptidase proteolytic subunit ClpP
MADETTAPVETPAMRAKLEAEAEKLLAEKESALALAAFNNAQASRVKHEIVEAEADARIKTAQAIDCEIDLERAQEKRRAEKAADSFHHIYVFSGQVDKSTTSACIKTLTEWMRIEPGCEIEIVFNSPGGSVIDGMALFDYIQTVRRNGSKVTTSTIGYAASMAGILLQAGDERVMGRQSWLMIHEASFGAGGKIGEVEDTVEWVKRVCGRIVDIFVERCQNAETADPRKRLTKARFIAGWRRKDWWITSEEALAMGLIDAIR